MSANGGVGVRERRYFVAPYALTGCRWELAVTVLCCLLLTAVLIAELLTPDVVVAALQLLPLLAAMWLLSTGRALVVAAWAATLFGVALIREPSNRWTMLIIAFATVVVTAGTRVYASAVARMLAVGPTFGGLTRREREVARLASQAYTAAEIGARLHIGERTVETHLANTYTKLRISSRRELIRIASRLDPQ
jgi:DNA-binding CsgD family transcriptional regulator